jgi:CRP/FNR family cyclic AMP-dependent transcriptional regulator
MLEKVQFFDGLSELTIQEIESTAERRKYKRGSIIIKKDDTADYLYVLLSGQVHAFIDDEAGKRVIVNTIGSDELFGELAMFSGDKRSASILAAENCEVLIIQRDDVLRAIREFPDFCFNVIQRLSKKINSLTEDVSCLALLDNYGRIVRLLQEQAHKSEEGNLTERLTQQEIADHIGSSREMVSRILKDLKIGGYIEIDNKRIRILKVLPKAW